MVLTCHPPFRAAGGFEGPVGVLAHGGFACRVAAWASGDSAA